ncbi:hypothetical protein [Risungbinella massiliensis]|uniref:hypothetical protein n=1 Tax=Risungbinella massiliensis TaxID=1329796 RepID=UPI0012B65BAB|nr:hypothetical protein [Risungbinella massiliensis]
MADEIKMKMIAIRITPEKAKELKIYLAKKDLSLQEFLENYIDKTLEEDSSQ